jgi:putative PEP-CTERM system TPR-repeat lipoprotein
MIAVHQRQFDAARERLMGILKDHPDRLDVMLRMARLEQAANQGEEALSWLERAVAAHPQLPITHLYLSRFLLLTRDAAKAAETAAAALERFPKEPSLLEVLGQAQLAAGRREEAIGTLGTLVEVRPDVAQSHLLLANAYGSIGDREKQRSALEKALSVQPGNPAARLEMARFLVQQRELTDAQMRVDQLMREFPNSPAVLELAGNLVTAKGNAADAVRIYERLWQAAPSTNSTLLLATAKWRAGDGEGALSTLEKWVSQNPRDVPARAFLASQYTAVERYGEAKTLLTALVTEVPDSATFHNDLAWVLLKIGDLEGATSHADRAVQLEPGNPLIMDTLAMILLEQDQTDRAVDLLREASTRAAGNPTVLYHYALALSRAGKDDSARQILRDLVQSNRKFDERVEAETLLRKLGG